MGPQGPIYGVCGDTWGSQAPSMGCVGRLWVTHDAVPQQRPQGRALPPQAVQVEGQALQQPPVAKLQQSGPKGAI